MKNLSYLFILAGILLFSACDKAEMDSALSENTELKKANRSVNFTAHLSGSNVITLPNPTEATGQAIFHLSQDGTSLNYKLIVANIENVTMAHIHMASATATGPVSVWLYPSAPPASPINGPVNGILAEGTITEANFVGPLAGKPFSALLDSIAIGKTYVNVHTTLNPGGEMRGQLK